ncbi:MULTISPECIES: putative GTP cyclohydrolase II [Kamptonema]|uniref:putative GTP cyclohydrolase II n=1 Tax=Kamptonema TaxID=1501433 RepID=UPI0001DAC32C|nr:MULTISPECIES: putative GTP cyclohydrolase II [Kamptonema]CBN58482.1 putative GTP cyclohydrolase II [Kamptonema sp. PCC 6506]
MTTSPTIVDKVLGISLLFKEKVNLLMGGYKIRMDGVEAEHGVIYKGNIENPEEPILLRINSACYTSDIFGCQRCDCNWQLRQAIDTIERSENGLIIYHFNHEGRGAGWTNKLKTYALMEQRNYTTFEAFSHLGIQVDQRSYYPAILILKDLNIKVVNLMSNNLDKENFLIANGVKVNQRIPLVSHKKEWQKYLISKKIQFGHDIQ